jgi:hypothetical protein
MVHQFYILFCSPSQGVSANLMQLWLLLFHILHASATSIMADQRPKFPIFSSLFLSMGVYFINTGVVHVILMCKQEGISVVD